MPLLRFHQRLSAPIIAWAVGSTWLGNMPAGQPAGGAALFDASLSDQLVLLRSAMSSPFNRRARRCRALRVGAQRLDVVPGGHDGAQGLLHAGVDRGERVRI